MKKGKSKDKFIVFSLFAILGFSFFFLFFFIRISVTGNFVKSGTGPYTYTCSSCYDCTSAIADASPGDTILLNQSISASGSNCINFTGKSHINFNCQNNLISGAIPAYGMMLISSNNIVVSNCPLTGFVVGVYLSSSDYNTFMSIRTDYGGSGISLVSSNNNTFSSINASDNYYGVYSYLASNNSFTDLTANRNTYDGITFVQSCSNNYFYNLNANYNGWAGINASYLSPYTIIKNSNLNYNAVGIYQGYFSNMTITNSHIVGNSQYGMYLSDGGWSNFVYNNFFNNSNNCYIITGGSFNPAFSIYYSFFNISKTTATNIIGKAYSGGNFWATPTGTGFSQNCTSDTNSDYICDYPYNLTGGYDLLPLIYAAVNVTTNTTSCAESWMCTNWTACNISGKRVRTCTDDNYCGTNNTRPPLIGNCTYSNTTTTPPQNTTTPPTTPNTGANSTTGIGANVTQNMTTVTPENPAVITIDDSQIYLTKITLNVLDSIQSATVTVTKVNILANSNLAVGLPSGQLYQGFKVDTFGVSNSNIANVTIEFKVNKQWLAGKSGTASGIKLYRRPDMSSQWDSLTTSLTSQDATYYYFTSVSPGFSAFAVFFDANAVTEEEEVTNKPQIISLLIYVLIGVVSMAIIITSLLLVRKLKKKHQQPRV